MGEILSTIGSWIKTRYEQVTRALKEAWGVVKSVFEGIMDAVRRVLDAVSCFSFTRETESISVQSETTGAGGRTTKTSVEVGLPPRNSESFVQLKLGMDYLLISVYPLAYTTKPANSSVGSL